MSTEGIALITRRSMMQGPAPCDACDFQRHCAARKESCHDFLLFINGNWSEHRKPNRQPNKKHYQFAYRGAPNP